MTTKPPPGEGGGWDEAGDGKSFPHPQPTTALAESSRYPAGLLFLEREEQVLHQAAYRLVDDLPLRGPWAQHVLDELSEAFCAVAQLRRHLEREVAPERSDQ